MMILLMFNVFRIVGVKNERVIFVLLIVRMVWWLNLLINCRKISVVIIKIILIIIVKLVVICGVKLI